MNDMKLLEFMYVGADFVLIFHTDNPISITKDNNEKLYNSFNKILNNDYLFDSSGLSYKKENEICWFSDQYCDIENINQTNRISRLIIKKVNDIIELKAENPFFLENNIKERDYIISFSQFGNGLYSLNKETGLTFQDDIVTVFKSINFEEKKKVKIR